MALLAKVVHHFSNPILNSLDVPPIAPEHLGQGDRAPRACLKEQPLFAAVQSQCAISPSLPSFQTCLRKRKHEMKSYNLYLSVTKEEEKENRSLKATHGWFSDLGQVCIMKRPGKQKGGITPSSPRKHTHACMHAHTCAHTHIPHTPHPPQSWTVKRNSVQHHSKQKGGGGGGGIETPNRWRLANQLDNSLKMEHLTFQSFVWVWRCKCKCCVWHNNRCVTQSSCWHATFKLTNTIPLGPLQMERNSLTKLLGEVDHVLVLRMNNGTTSFIVLSINVD